LAIAAALCIRETPTMVMNATIEDDWYAYLWSVMSGTLSKVDEVPFEKIKIITFNYDRSLEYFFHEAICNSFKLSVDEGFKQLGRLEVFFMYMDRWVITPARKRYVSMTPLCLTTYYGRPRKAYA
jgi:hypothetical protein